VGAGRPGFVAVRDDRAARRLAAAQGVPVLGALRVIVKVTERGLIPLARPALEKTAGQRSRRERRMD
jgi:predicted nucleic acid-binding protein